METRFLEALRSAVGEAGLVTDLPDRLTYESDALTHLRAVPGAVVLPSTVEQVQQVVRVCVAAGVPFVARGHGTGLSGGALPAERNGS